MPRVLTRSHLPEALVQLRGDGVGEEVPVCPVSCLTGGQTRDDVTTDQVLSGLMTREGKEWLKPGFSEAI